MNLKIMMMMSCTDYIDDVDVDIHDDLDEDYERNDDDDHRVGGLRSFGEPEKVRMETVQ